MNTFKKIEELRAELLKYRLENKKIGLVPTMGALHHGHISLVEQAKEKSDVVAVSIFVNPTQFNNPEDLEKYPRNIERDLDLLKKAGCDIVFTPEVTEMYAGSHDLKISFGVLENSLEGKFRPGHFSGVGQIVSKLFNIFQPDSAFFGQKDLQQFFIIKKLIDQLCFPIELHMIPTKREDNGLAMSSRNERLTQEEKLEAGLIYQTLKQSAEAILEGTSIHHVIEQANELFEKNERLTLEYFEVVETENFTGISTVSDPKTTALCIAAEIGKVRLIDNLLLNY
ncbi:pantoate--beta-alanine ligase [Roseivirga ehrenbergii]|uniref:Pantothenate synthetase n=1 Tax=Roseivirga ehrenbergii (strain DSM 102268 / JCM 13514 / KCTC 12282 / NCIMB 14502 / KMM 6017) TaxID=279360 RepID=A0A150XU20_ROSEK|nr:pantoate--beta-alanine ligase [Roseivirga ehrenbergii]KYG82174.1 pantoate--beta-alanine ligase [Roseivirga ehrenbergii]TCL02001.1 pantoate--beta-alanine ligase [Roseivirga ehrenbergii]